MHSLVKVPCQSVPAAALADDTSASAEGGACADKQTDATIADVSVPRARRPTFMAGLLRAVPRRIAGVLEQVK